VFPAEKWGESLRELGKKTDIVGRVTEKGIGWNMGNFQDPPFEGSKSGVADKTNPSGKVPGKRGLDRVCGGTQTAQRTDTV